MKINKILFAIFTLVAITMVACSEYEDTIVPGPEVPAGNQGVNFPASNQSVFELEPTEATEITVTIARDVESGAVDVPIVVENNDDNVFDVPESVSFADGQKEVDFTVSFPDAGEGTTYNLKLALEGDQFVNPYSSKPITYTANVTRIKWEPVEEPMVYVDGAFTGGYGVNSFPMYVNAEKAQLGGAVRYRFLNVYDVPTQDPDEDGIYDGYPYNDEGDFDVNNDYYTIIEIDNAAGTSGNVYMYPHEIGVDWSYGMISIGSVNATTLGTLSNSVITFPEESLFFSEAGYNDGQRFPASAPTLIYLTKDAFIAANMKIDDFNDVEYEAVVGEVGEFNSSAYEEVVDKTLYKAIDIDIDNEESEYKNLYYLADLYAEGYGVAFYYSEGGDVKLPENQPIGTSVFGQDLYVSQSENHESTVEVNYKGVTVYTLGLMFHFEDGTIVGEFEEKFYFSEDAVVYEKDDFIGDFVMTGLSQFAGEDDANMEVVIEESETENKFVITGVDYAEEILADFDPTTMTLSVAPQELADLVSGENVYDLTLYTTDASGVSATAIIDLVFNIEGNLVLSSTSEADGYLISSEAAGGSVDGYYNLQFSPVEAEVESLITKSASTLRISAKSDGAIVDKSESNNSSNFRIQGNKSQGKPKRINR